MLGGSETDLADLGDPVDQAGDLGTEAVLDIGQRDVGILDRIVQQRRDDTGLVQLQAGQDVGHGQRMCDIGLAGTPHLVPVRMRGEHVGAVDQVEIGLRRIGADALGDFKDAAHGCIPSERKKGQDARQPQSGGQISSSSRRCWAASAAWAAS